MVQKDVGEHDTPWSNTPAVLPPPELWYSFKAAIIRRLSSSCCYDRMLWECILVPRTLGCLPLLKVTEILSILHDSEGGWTEAAGRSLWIWKSLLFGLPHCPYCPSPPDQLYSADSSRVGSRGQVHKSSLTKHVAEAPAILILIIDQIIKANGDIFFLLKWKVWLCICDLSRDLLLPKDQYLQSRKRALLSVTLSRVITIES